MKAEFTIDFAGSTELAYYFAGGCGSNRVQNWWLYIDNALEKNGVITVTGNGQYLVFQLDNVVPGTNVRLETQNQVPTQCNPNPPPPGGPPNNTVLSGVFLNCKPKCSIGDFVFEDANADGCQDPSERPIEGVEVILYEGNQSCGSEVVKATIFTDENGRYDFTGLDCSKGYRVQFGDAGDIYAYTKADQDCSLTDPPSVPSDAKDSDCSQTDGFSQCVTFLNPADPDFDPNNPTVDCGYVCEGEIGDFVWLDSNGTPGCQDPNEPGIKDVIVDLYQVDGCADVGGLDPFKTTRTDDQGKYLFTGLCPGDYRVKFIDPEGRDNTTVNQSCENFPPGPPPGTTDSDCGGPGECVTLTVGSPVDETIDCGKLPPECALAVDKKCQVEPAATGPFECKDKVDALKMIWNGPGTLLSVDALPGGNDSFPKVEITVENGDQVVTVTDYQPSSNDVIWNWVSDGDSGQSKFHLSCSDHEMDGPEDCGKPQGNGKSNEDDKYDNVWLLDGLTTDKGFVLDCTPQPAEPSDNCEFEASPVPGCKTDPEVNDLTSITFRYTGADCSASNNDQGEIGDKWDCEGVPGTDPVSITVIKDAGKTSTNKASVNVGDIFTLGNDFSSESIVAVGGQTLTFHTSCSQPLAVGDVFGSLEVVGINGLSPGAKVTYFYEVTNVGETDAEVTSVFDDQLGELLGTSKTLTPGGNFTLEETAFISETTKNTVNVQGNIAGTIFECSGASDAVTVTVKQPTCDVAIAFEKLEDDKIKWKITNTSAIVATLETFVLNFPGSYGVIEKVKLDGDIYKADDSSLVVGPGVVITAGDWTQSDVSKRQLDPGETRDLEVEFTQKGDRSGWVAITVLGGTTFAEGCAVEFPVVGGCALGKPTALVFEYTGAACSATTNFQEGNFKCEETGTLGTLVKVEMTKDADKILVQQSGTRSQSSGTIRRARSFRRKSSTRSPVQPEPNRKPCTHRAPSRSMWAISSAP